MKAGKLRHADFGWQTLPLKGNASGLQGLSFQIWPSSLSLASFAEEKSRQHPGFWKVCSNYTGMGVMQGAGVQFRPRGIPSRAVVPPPSQNDLDLLQIQHSLHLAKSQCWLQGRHVVELGSGCGLVGLLLATLGAHVALTDLPVTMVSPAECFLDPSSCVLGVHP